MQREKLAQKDTTPVRKREGGEAKNQTEIRAQMMRNNERERKGGEGGGVGELLL